jgi:hypothetical protein
VSIFLKKLLEPLEDAVEARSAQVRAPVRGGSGLAVECLADRGVVVVLAFDDAFPKFASICLSASARPGSSRG